MREFIRDMIHMTEGEKLVEYWWVWLIMCLVFAYILYKKE